MINEKVIIAELERLKKTESINKDCEKEIDRQFEEIVNKALYGKEPEMVDIDDLPLDACNIQYASIDGAIKAHAEDYSFNIESELFNQLSPELQKLWRKEIEQAVISGGYSGLNLARDRRYDDTHEVKEVNSNDAFIEKAAKWIEEINNHHHIMRYSDSCEPPLSELTEWFRNYMEGE